MIYIYVHIYIYTDMGMLIPSDINLLIDFQTGGNHQLQDKHGCKMAHLPQLYPWCLSFTMQCMTATGGLK